MHVRIELTYKTAKGTETTFSSAEMLAPKALLIAEDFDRTGRVKNLVFVDQNESSWLLKELKKYLAEVETEPHDISVYFDGGFDVKTKRSGLGCVIYYQQNRKKFRLRKNALVDHLQTNNEAEYAALHMAIKELELLDVHHLPVTFVGDSQVVINQLTGEWACLEAELNSWADRIENKLTQVGITPVYHAVSRKDNQEADQLASQALKEVEITSAIELTKD